jgi:hypothetical protein
MIFWRHFHPTCSRCGAGVEVGTNGQGRLTERVVPCSCNKSWQRVREKAAAMTQLLPICVDCGQPASRSNAKRCLACAMASDLKKNAERNARVRQWAAKHAAPGTCAVCGEPVVQGGRLHKGCHAQAGRMAQAERVAAA